MLLRTALLWYLPPARHPRPHPAKRQATVKGPACQGHAQCEDAAPEVFGVGDDALSHLRMEAPPEQLRLKVEEAVRRCPTEAIRIEDG